MFVLLRHAELLASQTHNGGSFVAVPAAVQDGVGQSVSGESFPGRQESSPAVRARSALRRPLSSRRGNSTEVPGKLSAGSAGSVLRPARRARAVRLADRRLEDAVLTTRRPVEQTSPRTLALIMFQRGTS